MNYGVHKKSLDLSQVQVQAQNFKYQCDFQQPSGLLGRLTSICFSTLSSSTLETSTRLALLLGQFLKTPAVWRHTHISAQNQHYTSLVMLSHHSGEQVLSSMPAL